MRSLVDRAILDYDRPRRVYEDPAGAANDRNGHVALYVDETKGGRRARFASSGLARSSREWNKVMARY